MFYLLKGLARSPSSSKVWERGLRCTTSKKPCLLPFSISMASPRLFSCDSLRPYVLNPPVKWARPRAVPTAMAPPNTFGNVLTTQTLSQYLTPKQTNAYLQVEPIIPPAAAPPRKVFHADSFSLRLAETFSTNVKAVPTAPIPIISHNKST